MSKNKATLEPIHIREIFREEVLEPLSMAPCALAAEEYVPSTRIERLVREAPVTPNTARVWPATSVPAPSSDLACAPTTTLRRCGRQCKIV
jgi:hypothetical protein